MTEPRPADRKRRLVAIDGALALMAVVLMVQMWLLTATLEQFLRGHRSIAGPAAIAAGVLFAGCAALALLVHRIDTTNRRPTDKTERR
jgi:predicted Co/Zn/Cd cation transporter (cation efflux family)